MKRGRAVFLALQAKEGRVLAGSEAPAAPCENSP